MPTAGDILATVLTVVIVTSFWFVQVRRARSKARGQKLEKNQIARTQPSTKSNTSRRVN